MTWRARTVVIVGVLGVVFLSATARLFVWPPTDPPARVDAIVALGGDPGQRRADLALKLARAGYAPVAMISRGGNPPAPCPRTGRIVVVCFRADPLDTRGEAEFSAHLAARRHWKQLIVVSERSQATRARLLFERCTPVDMRWVPVRDQLSHLPFDVVYEWGALMKALVLVPHC
jgi:hypothetical protein